VTVSPDYGFAEATNALNIQPGQIILDAGCGNGYMAKAFAKRVSPSGKVYALDNDTHSINILKTEMQDTNMDRQACAGTGFRSAIFSYWRRLCELIEAL
jgi:ubiquinone/menaquinone biosynthesis C-methylase UbiE